MLLERHKAGSRGRVHSWWNHDVSSGGDWRSSRSKQSNAGQALRSLILYPTNALVEDQISRLRKAAMRATDNCEPLFYFGRYTGGTSRWFLEPEQYYAE